MALYPSSNQVTGSRSGLTFFAWRKLVEPSALVHISTRMRVIRAISMKKETRNHGKRLLRQRH